MCFSCGRGNKFGVQSGFCSRKWIACADKQDYYTRIKGNLALPSFSLSFSFILQIFSIKVFGICKWEVGALSLLYMHNVLLLVSSFPREKERKLGNNSFF